MKVKFNFDIRAWVSGVEVEGASETDVKENLFKMSLEDLIREGVVEDFHIEDLDGNLIEKSMEVLVTDILYDKYGEDMESNYTEELPQELRVTLKNVSNSDNIVSLITDKIEDVVGYAPYDFMYKVERNF